MASTVHWPIKHTALSLKIGGSFALSFVLLRALKIQSLYASIPSVEYAARSHVVDEILFFPHRGRTFI